MVVENMIVSSDYFNFPISASNSAHKKTALDSSFLKKLMKTQVLAPLIAAFAVLGLAHAAPVNITPAILPANNTTATFTSVDSKLTLNCWQDTAKTIPANIGHDGTTYFGIFGGVNNLGIDSSATVNEKMELAFAASAGLSEIEMAFVSPQGVTTISGFSKNPGALLNPGSNASETGSLSYDEGTGTLSIDLNYFGVIPAKIRFLNPAASAGQTLTIGRNNDGPGRQTPLTRITYEDAVDTTVKVLGSGPLLPTNSINTHTTGDGKLTVKGWADSSQTTAANFGANIAFFGVMGNNNNAIDSAESVTIAVGSDATVTDLVIRWSSADSSFEIAGFSSDPGASLDINGTPSETGSTSYSAGVVTVSLSSFSGHQRVIHFSNPPAIVGQTLILRRAGGVGQVSLNYVVYLDTLPTTGPFETWAAANISDPAKRQPTADADADGVDNLAEFALFSDPDSGDSLPQLTAANSGADLTLTYKRAIAATNVTFVAEWSTNLGTWSIAGITDLPTGNADANTTEYRATIAKGTDPAKFLRLRIVKP